MFQSSNTILITGGAGFIGSQAGEYFLEKDHEVYFVDNLSHGHKENLDLISSFSGATFIEEDVRTHEFSSILEDINPDFILHFAAVSSLPVCQSNPRPTLSNNVVATTNVFESARDLSGLEGIIFASTGAIYENNTVFPSREDDDVEPDLMYSMSKKFSEEIADSYRGNYGLPIDTVRLHNVYGPHQDYYRKSPPLIGYVIKKLLNDQAPELHSDGTQERDYIYISDVINMFEKLMFESDDNGVYNCSSGETVSVKEIYDLICDIMGKDIEAEYHDSPHLWQDYDRLFEGEFSFDEGRVVQEVNKFTLGSNFKAKRELGWEPEVGMREGLENIVEYVRDNRNLIE